jgi:signal transduction histidine kinase
MFRKFIAYKVIAPVLFVSLLSIVLAFFQFNLISSVERRYNGILSGSVAAALQAQMLGINIANISGVTYRAVESKDASRIKEARGDLMELAMAGRRHMTRVIELSERARPELLPSAHELLQETEITVRIAIQIVDLALELSPEAEERAQMLLRVEFAPMSSSISGRTDEISAALFDEMASQSRAITIDLAQDRMLMIATIGGVSTIGIIIGILASLTWISRPIQAMATTMERLANRDWAAEVPHEGRRDELGLMARAVGLFKANGLKFDEMVEADKELNRALRASREDLLETIEKLSQAREVLAEQEKMASLGRVVAGVAHEVNTPLGVAITCSSSFSTFLEEFKGIVESSTLRRSDLTEFIKIADEATSILSVNLKRAAGLINSFKLVAANQHVGNPQQVELSAYLADIMASLVPEIRRHGHRIDLILDKPVNATLRIDALWQILSGLTMNAINHAFPPGHRGVLTLALEQENDKVVIRFRDNGVGMAQDVLRQIFEPFFTTKRGQGGTGLGLSILYTLVTQALNGRVYCDSKPGSGSEFVITVPSM